MRRCDKKGFEAERKVDKSFVGLTIWISNLYHENEKG